MTASHTFLFTDLEASSRHWEEHPERMMAVMARHDAVLREAVLTHGGRVVKMAGDGIHAAFGDAVPALEAALRIQVALRDPASTEGIRLKVRCGLHAGTAEERDDDFYGPTVNRCARLAGAANGGQVVLSESVRAAAAGRLPEGMFLRSLGSVRLRDLSRTEAVFQLTHPELPGDFPPLRTLANNPNNLPGLLTSFVGRHKELRAIDRLFEGSRLVTLVGAGGIGKTRLALQAAAWRLDRYEDGVWFADLAAISQPALVAPTVARALGLRESQGANNTEAVIDFVRTRRLLVVLDNCEHLLDACAQFADALLRAAPSVHILATGREGLEIDGEAALRIPTLPIPDPDVVGSFADVLAIESVQLLVERAMQQRPDLEIDEAGARLLARICFRLDGIPLALELAAARLRDASIEEVDRSLSDRFGFLVSGSRVAAPRQKTLAAMVDWSWRLLAEDERLLFERLAVFDGGFGAAAVAQACAGDGLEPERVEPCLRGLIRKSLVVELVDGRFRLLETVREFARAQLDRRGTRAQFESRHARHFLAVAELARPRIASGDRAAAVAELDAELDNFRAALAWLEGHDLRGLTAACRALGPYWNYSGRIAEGRARMESLVARGPEGEPDATWAGFLYSTAVFAYRQCDLAAAERLASESFAIRRTLGIVGPAGIARSLMAISRFVQEGAEAADAHYVEAVAMMEQAGERYHAAHQLLNRAIGWVHVARFDIVGECVARAQELAAGREDAWLLGRFAEAEGWSALVESRYEDAVGHFERAVAFAQQGGDRAVETLARISLASAFTGAGRHPDAAREFAVAIATMREQGTTLELVNALESFAGWLAASGQADAAVRLCETTLKVRERIGFPIGAQARRARGRALDAVMMDEARRRILEREGRGVSLEDAVAATLAQALEGSR